MSEIKFNSLSLVVDGKTVEVKKPSKKNFELNKALLDSSGFQEFVADPKAFAAKHDLIIDRDVSTALKGKLAGLKNLDDVRAMMPSGGDSPCTVWAVAQGIYSISSSKVAVAF